jgi:multiple sugar transport system permease protein
MATIAQPVRARRRNRSRNRSRGVVRLLLLLALLVVVLYPVAFMIGSSVKSPTEILSSVSVLPKDFTPGNYTRGWSSQSFSFGTFLLNSTLVAALVVIGNMFSCLVSAYAFARLRFPGRRIFFALMIGTLLLPAHVLIVPQYILFKAFGWVGGDFPYTPLIVPHFLGIDAFFVFLMVQFMRGVPHELDEAAKIDGCSPYGVFRYVILPLSRPALVTTAIFSFIWTWNDFFRQLVYLSDPDRYTVPVALTLFLDSTGSNAVGPMFAMSVLSLLPVFLFFLAFQRLLVQGINTSGLKG